MLHIDEQQSVFETFCSERYGENGCQTSKTITREKGQKIPRLRGTYTLAVGPLHSTVRQCLPTGRLMM